MRDTLRSALRGLSRSPGLSALVVLMLGVGIGANVGLFSMLRSVVLRPLPYPDADRLVQLWEANPEVDDELHGPSPWNFSDWEGQVAGLDLMAAWYLTSGTYRGDSWIEEVRSAQVTPDFFRTLGVAPLLGRDFRPSEVDRYGPVMLSHRVWHRLFGADPAVVGQTVVTSGETYEIVGVMPEGFAFPDESVETWVAWDLPSVYADRPESRTWRFLSAVGRLAPLVTLEAAEAELDLVAAGLAERYPVMNRGWDAEVTSLHEETVGDVRATLWIAFGSVLFILLIACANVANLLMARVPARVQEVRIRTALGASRGRIATELLTESALLAAAAGVVGLGLGSLLIELLVALDAGRIPRLAEVSLDRTVFLFTLFVAAGTALVFGSGPVLQLLRRSEAGVESGVRTTGSSAHRKLRSTLVGAQIALALVLLTGAALFGTSLQRLTRVDPGLDPDRVASFRVSLDPVDGTAAEIVRYYEGLIERLEAVPGVVAVAAAQTLPMNPVGNDFQRPYRRIGAGTSSSESPAVQMRIVTPRYVDVLGIPVLEGAGMPAEAALDEPLVALVNRTLSRRLWPNESAVGQAFEIDFRDGWEPYRVVGVVEDVKHYGLRSDAVPEVFLAHAQVPYLAMSVVARTEGDPDLMFQPLREAVLTHTPMQPAHNFVSLADLLADSTAEERFLSTIIAVFAFLGLGLAATGVYGIIAYSVSLRRREMGVRMALGAAPRQLVVRVLGEALGIAGAGLVVGLAGVLLLGASIESLLFGVTPTDPGATLGVAAALAAVATIAAYLPARRAAQIEPTEALRAE